MVNFDMRGLKLSERKELLEWFFLHVDILATQGQYKAYKYLQTLPAADKEFTQKALKGLTEEDDDEGEDILITSIDEKEALRSYT